MSEKKHVWVAALGVVEMCSCQMNIIHTSRETLQFLDNSRSWVVPGSNVLSNECDLMGAHLCIPRTAGGDLNASIHKQIFTHRDMMSM